MDVPGIAALSLGLTALVLALVEGNRWGWGSPAILALLGAAVFALAAFAWLEPRVRAPVVDFGFFRSRTFLGANLAGFIVSFAMLAMFFFLALYMQDILGYSPLQAGVRFLPTTLLVIVTAPIAGRLADRMGSRRPMTGGLLLMAVALLLTTRIEVGTGYDRVLPALIMMGFGLGLTMAPMSTAAMNAVSATKAGVASGLLAMARMVGGTFGVAVLGALFQHSAPRGVGGAGRAARVAFVHSLSRGMWLCTGVAFAGALTAWALVERDRAS